MKLHEFADLASAQAYTEAGTKMISPDMMVAFLTTFGCMASISGSVTNEALGMQAALNFGSEFNLINGHPASVSPLMDILIADGVLTSTLKDYCVAYANPVSTPHANATQEEYDAEVAKAALVGELEAHSYTIGGFPTNEADAFIIKTRELICDVIFDAPAPIDCTVKVTAQLLDGTTGIYVPESVADTVRVSKDSRSKNYRIKKSFSARKMKFVATCSHNLAFQVKVREA